jgi:glycosyltransferase involved in cell wall biosynthesis
MKQNVLILIGSFHQGGSERQAIQLVRMLNESGRYNVHVACLNREGVLLAEFESYGFKDFPEYRLGSFYNRNFFRQLRAFARHLREHEISIIQTTDFYTNVFGMFGATIARTPIRIAAKREMEGHRTKAQDFVECRAYSRANAIVVNSNAVKKYLIEKGIAEKKLVTIHNGLDIERLTPTKNLSREEILSSFNLPTEKEKRIVTNVANLRSHVKDYPTFLRAARRISDVDSNAVFVIAGDGHLMDEMKTIATESGIEKKVYFLGRCDRVPELLSVTDVCVLSSKYEGFSNSIIEYMAAAKPVVATDVGGAREAIVEGEIGFIVQSGDDETIALRVLDLLRDEEKAKAMGAKGKERVVKEFSLAAQLERTERLYERLLNARSNGRSEYRL